MERLTALIVDDERLARRELAYLLRAHPEVEVVGEAATLEAAVAAVGRLRPQLVFLDVQMGDESGFDLFQMVDLEARVVFVTAHDEFALRAFDVNALDYLMKPVSPERLRCSLERVRRAFRTAPAERLGYGDSVFVAIDRAPRFVRLRSIVCIRAEGDYTRLVGGRGSLGLVLKPIRDWERLLPSPPFCRVQRSLIVNCDHVRTVEPSPSGIYTLELTGVAEPLRMSRRYGRELRRRFRV